jgi:hypothetical protein
MVPTFRAGAMRVHPRFFAAEEEEVDSGRHAEPLDSFCEDTRGKEKF